MAKRKIQLADGIKRVVYIETEATKGATIGTNLYAANGDLLTPALLRSYLGLTSSGSVATQHSQLQGLDGNDHPQYLLGTAFAAFQATLDDVAFSGSYYDLINTPTLGTAAALDVDTDGTLAANSDSKIATQKAVKTYVNATAGGSGGYPTQLGYAGIV